MNKQNSAVITATLAAGSVASPYFIEVNIAQRLCSPACEGQTPVFNPQFSLVGYSAVGTGQYIATIHVEGLISYVPCGGNSCCTRTQLISQNFTIPFASATAPTSVTIEAGTTVNAIQVVACQNCSRDFTSATPITLTIATA